MRLAAAFCALLVACSGSSGPAPRSEPAGVQGVRASRSSGGGTSDARPRSEVDEVAAEMRAAMTELADYTERLYKIMREHGKDCDAAAKQLEALVEPFKAIGPRMMKVKERVQALPESDFDRIKRDAEGMMQDMMKRFSDADVIEARAKECEKTSKAFAAIAPKVAFVKKK